VHTQLRLEPGRRHGEIGMDALQYRFHIKAAIIKAVSPSSFFASISTLALRISLTVSILRLLLQPVLKPFCRFHPWHLNPLSIRVML
jgi:hypothetical protein